MDAQIITECQPILIRCAYQLGEERTVRCEDYPCCGHTDGLGCNWTFDSEAYMDMISSPHYDPYYEDYY